MPRSVRNSALCLILLVASMALVGAQTVRPEVVASGLQNPWAVAFLPEGRYLVTERGACG
jgi:glucose/arabinose dehydrogenase